MNHQAKTGDPCPHTGFYRCHDNHNVAMVAGHAMPHCRQCAPAAPVSWTLHEKKTPHPHPANWAPHQKEQEHAHR